MTRRPYESSAPAAVTTQQAEPVQRYTSVETEVTVPVLQSAVYAVAWAAVVGIIAAVVVFASRAPWWICPTAGVAAVAGLFAWQSSAAIRERRELLWRVERATGLDIDQNGHVGEPSVVKVEITTRDNNGKVRRQSYLNLPISEVQLLALARGLTNGVALAQSAWIGKGGPLSRAEFDSVRDRLILYGLAEWVNPDARAQGCVMTRAGRAVMRRIAENAAAPPPPQPGGGK